MAICFQSHPWYGVQLFIVCVLYAGIGLLPKSRICDMSGDNVVEGCLHKPLFNRFPAYHGQKVSNISPEVMYCGVMHAAFHTMCARLFLVILMEPSRLLINILLIILGLMFIVTIWTCTRGTMVHELL
jgi:hypothetical protein